MKINIEKIIIIIRKTLVHLEKIFMFIINNFWQIGFYLAHNVSKKFLTIANGTLILNEGIK